MCVVSCSRNLSVGKCDSSAVYLQINLTLAFHWHLRFRFASVVTHISFSATIQNPGEKSCWCFIDRNKVMLTSVLAYNISPAALTICVRSKSQSMGQIMMRFIHENTWLCFRERGCRVVFGQVIEFCPWSWDLHLHIIKVRNSLFSALKCDFNRQHPQCYCEMSEGTW